MQRPLPLRSSGFVSTGWETRLPVSPNMKRDESTTFTSYQTPLLRTLLTRLCSEGVSTVSLRPRDSKWVTKPPVPVCTCVRGPRYVTQFHLANDWVSWVLRSVKRPTDHLMVG